MYFSDIQISNYKSYQESPQLDLKLGINVIVGRNNAGKTALLEALSLGFESNPHRTIETIPTPSVLPKPQSSVRFTFTLSKHELIDSLIHVQSEGEFYLALPALTSEVAKQLEFRSYDVSELRKFADWFFSHETYKFSLTKEVLGNSNQANWSAPQDPYLFPIFERDVDLATNRYAKFQIDPLERAISIPEYSERGRSNRNDFVVRIGRSLNRYIYRFRAERFPSSPCPLGTERTLAPDASNLASVVNLLQANRTQLEQYTQLVREVLPDIYQVNTRRLNDNRGEVVVWNDEKAISRNHLAFTLNESGSGVGQVLAILYVLVTAEDPQVIILDEPQGFLHPGAVRKLVELLRHYTKDKHQLILATHSPTVIASADPSSVTLIEQVNAESTFKSIDVKAATEQRNLLGTVGVRLSDVFGYDRVLWVEGETEEICFPLILRELTTQILMGTAILRVQQTGDFNRKDARKVIEIYERLSQVEGGLVPPVVGFIFDREARSKTEQKDLKRQSRGRIHFTNKRHFENYLLNAGGIVNVLNSYADTNKVTITAADVQERIDEKRNNARYYKPLDVPAHGNWSNDVNGALLLEDLFEELSERTVIFDKTTHSPMLTDWVLKNSPEDLRDVSNLLETVLNIDHK